MPLVVPGVNNAMGEKTEWLQKLKGKKYVDSDNVATDENSFTRKDLPENCRVLKPTTPTTMDYRIERLNVHLDENNTVHDVSYY